MEFGGHFHSRKKKSNLSHSDVWFLSVGGAAKVNFFSGLGPMPTPKLLGVKHRKLKEFLKGAKEWEGGRERKSGNGRKGRSLKAKDTKQLQLIQSDGLNF